MSDSVIEHNSFWEQIHRILNGAYINVFAACCNCFAPDRWVQYTRVEPGDTSVNIYRKESFLMCCCKKIYLKDISKEACKYYELVDQSGEFEVICDQDENDILDELLRNC